MEPSIANGIRMPECLSTSELRQLLHEKSPNTSSNLEDLGRNDLIKLAWRLSCFPKPQRIPRNNRRGEIVRAKLAVDERNRGESTGSSSSSIAWKSKDEVTGQTRLKTAPAQREDGFIESKKIQLRKSGQQASSSASASSGMEIDSIVAGGIEESSSANGYNSRQAEKRERVQEDDKTTGESDSKQARKHRPIQYP